MSRSRKKIGIVKDVGDKKIHRRRERSVNKQRILEDKEPLLKSGITNPYNYSDWRYIWKGDVEERIRWDNRLYKHYDSFEDYKRFYFKK